MKPLLLCILDGFALRDEERANAIKAAKTPNLTYLFGEYPMAKLNASGMAVGLPEGQMGNSEVGHLNIGAGRVVYQSLTQINKSIVDGDFYKNDKFLAAIEHVKKNDSNLHIMGLLSDGGVHSHTEHIYALLKLAKEQGLKQVFVHCFMDGRDVKPDSGAGFLAELEAKMKEIGIGAIATVAGRYYPMDRDKRFERLALGYEAIVEGKGIKFTNAVEYAKASYAEGKFDEFILPGVNTDVDGKLMDNDAVIFANFRPDRAIQIGSAITNPEYMYKPEVRRENIYFVCMMKYAESVKGVIAYEPQTLENKFGPYIAEKGLTQLRIAETEKYAHVTFFFDGGVHYDGKEEPELKGCKRILVDSPKVATYDLQPEMSADIVTEKLLEQLDNNPQDVIILNFANCDMVGHTAIFDAIVKAVETVDTCVGKIYNKIQEIGGTMIITADHGNAEEVFDENNQPITSHTTNQVPFLITDKNIDLLPEGKLGDIAPTMLQMLGVEKPKEMDGHSLIRVNCVR